MFRRTDLDTKDSAALKTMDSTTLSEKSSFRSPSIPQNLASKEEESETVLGEEVSFKGELAFKKSLRIDGCFEGKLLSEGKLHVGPKGHVKCNINMQEAIIEGKVEGNICLKGRLELRQNSFVQGDVQAKSIKIEEGACIIGIINIGPELTTD